MTAAAKTPMITPVYADEAVEGNEGRGRGLIHIPAHPGTCDRPVTGLHGGLQRLNSVNVQLKSFCISI